MTIEAVSIVEQEGEGLELCEIVQLGYESASWIKSRPFLGQRESKTKVYRRRYGQ